MASKKHGRFDPLKPAVDEPNIIAFDTEDNGTGAPGNFICAAFHDSKGSHVFTERDDARQYLLAGHKERTIIFAHNLAYDLTNLDYPEGSVQRFSLPSRLIGGTYEASKGKHTKFMDTGNFFVGASIDSLGARLGYPKIDFDIKRIKNKKFENLDDKTKAEVLEYCARDAEICYKTAMKISNLCIKHETRFKAFTTSSLAMRIFRTHYMHASWEKRDMLINDFERLAYYGGRTEAFEYNQHNEVVHEDIRSSYPSAMKYEVFPHPSYYAHIVPESWDEVRDNDGISLVRVHVPDMHIPPLPYRRMKDGKLLFPVGTWTGAYTHPELRMAEKHGVEILNVFDSLIYFKKFRPFEKYIDDFYMMKDTSKGIERDFYKLLLNGLSGKFGEKRSVIVCGNSQNLDICRCRRPDTGNRMTCKKCGKPDFAGAELNCDENGWISFIGDRLEDPSHSFPVLIAYITAYGRIKLYEDRLKHQDAYYVDTDSYMGPEKHDDNLGPSLGQWERDIYKNFIAFAPKFYEYTTPDGLDAASDMRHMKLKGVPKRHNVIYECPTCMAQMDKPGKCSCGGEIEYGHKKYKFEKPSKLAEAIRRKLKPNKWSHVIKKVSMIDKKRIRHDDGSSSPLKIEERFVPMTFQDMLEKVERIKVAELEIT